MYIYIYIYIHIRGPADQGGMAIEVSLFAPHLPQRESLPTQTDS